MTKLPKEMMAKVMAEFKKVKSKPVFTVVPLIYAGVEGRKIKKKFTLKEAVKKCKSYAYARVYCADYDYPIFQRFDFRPIFDIVKTFGPRIPEIANYINPPVLIAGNVYDVNGYNRIITNSRYRIEEALGKACSIHNTDDIKVLIHNYNKCVEGIIDSNPLLIDVDKSIKPVGTIKPDTYYFFDNKRYYTKNNNDFKRTIELRLV